VNLLQEKVEGKAFAFQRRQISEQHDRFVIAAAESSLGVSTAMLLT
jgi:hypothetical protein